MKSLDEFYNNCRDAEDFFKFFGIDFDQKLLNVKRFHMMKEYGNLIKRGMANIEGEEKTLEFLKFSLLRVYGDYVNGHSPSAADVWNMYETGKLEGCSSCSPSSTGTGGSCGC